MATYTVQAGDSWFRIAGILYGDQRFAQELASANASVGMLRPGMTINAPSFNTSATPYIGSDWLENQAASQAAAGVPYYTTGAGGRGEGGGFGVTPSPRDPSMLPQTPGISLNPVERGREGGLSEVRAATPPSTGVPRDALRTGFSTYGATVGESGVQYNPKQYAKAGTTKPPDVSRDFYPQPSIAPNPPRLIAPTEAGRLPKSYIPPVQRGVPGGFNPIPQPATLIAQAIDRQRRMARSERGVTVKEKNEGLYPVIGQQGVSAQGRGEGGGRGWGGPLVPTYEARALELEAELQAGLLALQQGDPSLMPQSIPTDYAWALSTYYGGSIATLPQDMAEMGYTYDVATRTWIFTGIPQGQTVPDYGILNGGSGYTPSGYNPIGYAGSSGGSSTGRTDLWQVMNGSLNFRMATG